MRRAFAIVGALACGLWVPTVALAAQASSPLPESPKPRFYAVEFTVGPQWDAAKPPQEQAYFRVHSANLKRLREAGSLMLGGRYSDKGLVILAASSEPEAHGMIRRDPSVAHGTFTYALDEVGFFYSYQEPKLLPTHEAYWTALQGMCGVRFEGAMTFPTEGRDDFAGKLLVATVATCDEDQIRVPFAVGEDRSRTWVFRRTKGGLELKHDHRHADGTPDAVTNYGGTTRGLGSAVSMSFAADAETAKLIPEAVTNVWTVSWNPEGTRLTYHLERDGKPRFTAVLERVGSGEQGARAAGGE